jgi:crossover junction endodeoxyribonuclease RuvC
MSRIIGIDPGLTRCGYGVIEMRGKPVLLSVGVIKSDPNLELPERLALINSSLIQLFAEFQPDFVAVERVFAQANVRTVMGTAQVSGLALVAAQNYGAQVRSYTPTEVKAAVTGSGRAEKSQVGEMVRKILNLDAIPKPADAADALAIAICQAWRGSANDRIADAMKRVK